MQSHHPLIMDAIELSECYMGIDCFKFLGLCILHRSILWVGHVLPFCFQIFYNEIDAPIMTG